MGFVYTINYTKNTFDMKKEVLFLFGSGISFETGMPSTRDILEKIQSKNFDDIHLEYNLTHQDENQHIYKEIIAYVYSKLNEVKSSLKLFVLDEEISYEDVYSTLIQILEYYRGLYNLSALPFLDEIWFKVKEISGSPENKIGDTVWNTIIFFNWAIREILLRTKDNLIPIKENIKGFGFLEQLQEEHNISDVYLFSLNHDLLIENYLGELIDTPFEKYAEDCNLKIYKKDFFDKSKKFHLYKLHGSVNWFASDKFPYLDRGNLFEYNASENYMEYYTEKMAPDGYHVMPKILTGAGIKEYYYQQGVYSDLIAKFRYKLNDTTALFVSGYGWKDSGINNMIIDWLMKDNNRKVIIFSKDISATNYKLDSSSIEKNMPPKLLWLYWDRFISKNRIILIDKWISESGVDVDILSNL